MRFRKRSVRAAVAAVLLGAATLVGCSAGVDSDPYAFITPGPAPEARPGAYVWAVGGSDLVLGSPDGGSSWNVSYGGDTDILTGDLWAVAFGDVDHGWAVRRGISSARVSILSTADAGATWSWQYPEPQARMLGIAAVGARRAWAVGTRDGKGLVLRTSDGGASWKSTVLGRDLELHDVAFTDARHGWLLGTDNDRQRSSVLATSDGGAHWRVVYRTTVSNLFGLSAAGTSRCWVVGTVQAGRSGGFLAMTGDGGRTWASRPSLTEQALSAVDFTDARHGWAVGNAGTILASADGGKTWQPQPTDARFDLRDVAFSDPAHGWALIAHGALLATSDGGATWTAVRPAPMQHAYLTAVTCAGPVGTKE